MYLKPTTCIDDCMDALKPSSILFSFPANCPPFQLPDIELYEVTQSSRGPEPDLTKVVGSGSWIILSCKQSAVGLKSERLECSGGDWSLSTIKCIRKTPMACLN